MRAIASIFLFGLAAGASASPIDEIEWATVGSPGNAPFVVDYGGGFEYRAGAVDHEFRIARTEVTGAQWLEFVNAYAPFVDPQYANNSEFTSGNIRLLPQGEYYMHPQLANYPIEAGWRFGARFVNWLHNGRANTREAFEAGVYDTSTFGQNPDGTITDQAVRSTDARYFLVSRDEWVKAAYFDPNRYGEGHPGYWQYPTSSDQPPVGGPPELGGQTSAGYPWYLPPKFNSPPQSGGYPETQSPLGVLDLSGGVREWTESWIVRGSEAGPTFPLVVDLITSEFGYDPRHLFGFRLGAAAVPSPSACVIAFLFAASRRRNSR